MGRNISAYAQRDRNRVDHIQHISQQKRRHRTAHEVIEDDRWWNVEIAAAPSSELPSTASEPTTASIVSPSTSVASSSAAASSAQLEPEFEEMKTGEDRSIDTSSSAPGSMRKRSRAEINPMQVSAASSGVIVESAFNDSMMIDDDVQTTHYQDPGIQKVMSTMPRSTEMKEHDRVIYHFVQHAKADITQIQPDAIWQVDAVRPITFLHALLNAHAELDLSDQLTPNMWQPYRVQLRSLIARSDPQQGYQWHRKTFSLPQLILLTWSINNRHHVAYEWLIGVSRGFVSDVSILYDDEASFNMTTPFDLWLSDPYARNDLVFHEFMKASNCTLFDTPDKDYILAMLNHGFDTQKAGKDKVLLMFSHDYALACYDQLFKFRGIVQKKQKKKVKKPSKKKVTGYPDSGSDEDDSSSSNTEAAILDPLTQKYPIQVCNTPLMNTSNVDLREINYKGFSISRADMRTSIERSIGRFMDDQEDFSGRIYFSPTTVQLVRDLMRLWNSVHRPRLYSELMESTSLVSDCAYLCLQYIDGSNCQQPGPPIYPLAVEEAVKEEHVESEEDES